jgi:hypothetical protein
MLPMVVWEEGGDRTDLELLLVSEFVVCWISTEIPDDEVGELIEFKSILRDCQERMRRERCAASKQQKGKDEGEKKKK